MSRMTTSAAWPTSQDQATAPHYDHDDLAGGGAPWEQGLHGQGSAHEVISEMADLLRQTRDGIVADGCLLSGVAIGLALEAGDSTRALHPTVGGAISLALLGGLVICWLAAVFLLARASRPTLNAVSELRWVTGAPLDPRPRWVTLPPVGAEPAQWSWNRAYLLLGAARLARYRMHSADTWTYLAGGCFVAWTATVILGL
jgi:hypothetical protein